MCGIVGALSFKGSSFDVSEEYLVRMRDALAHRGPDGAGAWISADRRIGLGHRRLAIIDLAPSAIQPMSNEDASIWIVFNGEIYNHAEIRATLEHIGGHRWKTDHSDTEVILHAFEQWGIDCLHRFRGMFAFALWDGRTNELWLVRDRIGIKPLYYAVHHGRIVFASEIKALLLDPDQQRGINEEAFYHYLSFLTTPAPETLFQGIKKLPAATWLKITSQGRRVEQHYWDVWENSGPILSGGEDEIAERLLMELRTSVKLRKVSDVPVGVFLSGGIDSSTNAALFSEGETNVKTFTVGYDEEYASYPNELRYARVMAARVGAEHRERILRVEDLISFLPKMIRLQDEPIADPVCVPVYYVSKLARDNGVIVCQLGEGADELFIGYPGWMKAYSLQRYSDSPIPVVAKQAFIRLLSLAGKGDSLTLEHLRRGAAGVPIFWGGAEAFSDTHKVALLSERLRKRFSGYSSWEVIRPIWRRFQENAWDKSYWNWMTYVDLNLRIPELLLMRVDKMSMGVGLEARVPFLDHQVVSLALGIPPALKVKNGSLKYILKKAVRGIVPKELIDRKKQGFGIPINEWFLRAWRDDARRQLQAFCRNSDFLDPAEVDRLFARGAAQQIWYLWNFALVVSHIMGTSAETQRIEPALSHTL